MRIEDDSVTKILDVIGALVVIMDSGGRIKYFNPTCENVTGFIFEEIKDNFIWDVLILEAEIKNVKSVFNKLRAGNFPNCNENYWKTKKGEVRLINWHNTALSDEEGNVVYVVGTGVDITELKHKEERLKYLSYHDRLTGLNNRLFLEEKMGQVILRD